jgi:hypothetical protein
MFNFGGVQIVSSSLPPRFSYSTMIFQLMDKDMTLIT